MNHTRMKSLACTTLLLLACLHGAAPAQDDSAATMATIAAMSAEKKIQALAEACEKGDLLLVKRMLAAGAFVNGDHNGFKPLHYASIGGHDAVVSALLDAGASATGGSTNGDVKPIIFAAGGGSTKIIQMLLDAGARLDTTNTFGMTPLYAAAAGGKLDMVKYLLAKGADPRVPDKDGMQAIHMAAKGGHAPVLAVLISAGANANAASTNGEQALMLAAKHGEPAPVNLLLSVRANVNARDKEERTALHYASSRASVAVVKALMAAGAGITQADKYGDQPLHFAIYNADPAVLKALLAAGAKVNTPDGKGKLPLFLTAEGKKGGSDQGADCGRGQGRPARSARAHALAGGCHPRCERRRCRIAGRGSRPEYRRHRGLAAAATRSAGSVGHVGQAATVEGSKSRRDRARWLASHHAP